MFSRNFNESGRWLLAVSWVPEPRKRVLAIGLTEMWHDMVDTTPVIAPGFSSQTAGNPTGFWLGWGMTSWIMKRGIWTAILHPSQLSDSWSSEMCRRLAADKPRGLLAKLKNYLGQSIERSEKSWVLSYILLASVSTFHGSLFSPQRTPQKTCPFRFLFFFACWCGTGFESLSRDSCVMLVPLEIGSMRHHFWRLNRKWPCMAKVAKGMWVI